MGATLPRASALGMRAGDAEVRAPGWWPHIAWLADCTPRDDKVLSQKEAENLLSGDVVVEEKLDGANIGISVDDESALRLQNRGQYLVPPYGGQFSRAAAWTEKHADDLVSALGDRLIMFGEWCAARHSIAYRQLPDWFVAFDFFDRDAEHFWSKHRRDELVERLNLPVVPVLLRGRTTLASLKAMVMDHPSRFGATQLEGLVIRREDDDFLEQRAKLVRANFTQSIGEHWRQRRIEWNSVAPT